MLPLSDDNRGRRIQPIVTWVLIAMNIAVFAYQWMLSEREHWLFLMDWAVVPNQISSGSDLHTLVTSAFLHGSWFHLGSNMLFLWIFGDNVEDVMGHAKYLLFYFATAIAAGLAQVVTAPESLVPMVGASGAVSGLLAAYIVLFPHGRVRTLLTLGIFITVIMLPAWIMIGYWFLLQVISGMLMLGQETTGGGVAFFAHIGGFLAGLILVWPLASRARLQHQRAARVKSSQAHTWGMGPGNRR
jgi:membrane associated rhomboid family serine protease